MSIVRLCAGVEGTLASSRPSPRLDADKTTAGEEERVGVDAIDKLDGDPTPASDEVQTGKDNETADETPAPVGAQGLPKPETPMAVDEQTGE